MSLLSAGTSTLNVLSTLVATVSLSMSVVLLNHVQADVPSSPEQLIAGLQRQWHDGEGNRREQRRLHREADAVRRTLCAQGRKQHCPPEELQAKHVDIYKLSRAVAFAETSGCAQGTGISRNN